MKGFSFLVAGTESMRGRELERVFFLFGVGPVGMQGKKFRFVVYPWKLEREMASWMFYLFEKVKEEVRWSLVIAYLSLGLWVCPHA